MKALSCVKLSLAKPTFPRAMYENLYVAKRHNMAHTSWSSGKDSQAEMALWDICRVRVGGHVANTKGYPIKTAPFPLSGRFLPP